MEYTQRTQNKGHFSLTTVKLIYSPMGADRNVS